jgi:hypothetical protein
MLTDPVHQHDSKWWFYDEVWADRIGPYDTEEIAREQVKYYAEYLDTGVVDPRVIKTGGVYD